MTKKLNKEEIIKQSKIYHDNYEVLDMWYIEELKKDEKRGRWWVKARCHQGHIFNMLWDNYKRVDCPECKRYNVSKQMRKYSIKDIGDRCSELEMEWVNKSEYEKSVIDKTKIKHIHVICKKCGNEVFRETSLLFSERKCGGCVNSIAKTNEKASEELFNVWKNEYSMIDTYKNNRDPMNIKHNICGNIFKSNFDNLIRGKCGCPYCIDNKSIGEKAIKNILNFNNVKFIPQYRFYDCRDILPLPFDFAIFDDDIENLNCLIEYQGLQHFEPVNIFGGEEKFKEQQKHDNIKRQYCKINNIKLIEIPYWEFNNIEKILKKWRL